jgi:alpha-ribazole phosphatase
LLTKLLLVRHGQTLWNHISRYQGHSDIDLSDTGRNQASLLSQRLATVSLQAVYASDLKRALDTARIVAEPHGLDVQALPQLREINFGAWEGLTYKEIESRYPEIASNWYSSPGSTRIPGGETFQELMERAYSTVTDLARKHDPGAIAVVTHGGAIRSIICALLGIDLNNVFRIRQDNATLNIIDFYDGYGILNLLNDTHHLETEPSSGSNSVFNR